MVFTRSAYHVGGMIGGLPAIQPVRTRRQGGAQRKAKRFGALPLVQALRLISTDSLRDAHSVQYAACLALSTNGASGSGSRASLRKAQPSSRMWVYSTHHKEDGMPTDEIIIRLFYMVDTQIADVNKRSDAHLYPSEIVTIGLLFALKGGRFRA